MRKSVEMYYIGDAVQTHRAPLNINEEAIETAKKELNRVATAMKQAYVKLGASMS